MPATKAFLALAAVASGVLGTAFSGSALPEPPNPGPPPAAPQAIGLRELSVPSQECADCHKKESLGLYQQWGASRHYRANVGCYECHKAEREDNDILVHYGYKIAVIVSPKDCARCHAKEVEEFLGSHHSKAGRILGSLDNVLAEVVEGNKGLQTEAFPGGVSAAAVSGCWQCHGSQIKVLQGAQTAGRLDPATWPNTGIGRLNPDGTEGACSACHSRHTFSVELARHPDNCGKCHLGPDHPQKEIYEESKHGIAFRSNVPKMNLGGNKWVLGEDYWAAPTCATCHMSATLHQPVSHDIGLRVSWNNRPAVSIRNENDEVSWQARRRFMQEVCLVCHNKWWVDNFYVQYDGLVELYNEKYAKPGLALFALAAPLKSPVGFANKIDFTWFELWHHEGRRARHGASMMGPDYTHWHGTYDLAKNFYSEFIPELEELVEKGLSSGDAAKVAAAHALEAKLAEVLATDNHKWFLGQMDPAEKEARAKAAEEFKKRYEK